MPPQGEGLARQWFIPGEGIDRHVISTDIQRYLGNDATVRPGRGTGDNQGVEGYWIKAYRNLTSAMIQDLRADSKKWRAEQQATGSRAPYDRSATYQQSNATVAVTQRRVQEGGRDSPSSMDEGQYAVGPGRNPQWNAGAMDIDQPGPPPGYFGQSSRGGYQPDGRYPPQPDRRQPYAPDQPMMEPGYRPSTTGTYGMDPRYAPAFPQPNNAPGGSYQGDMYVPPASGYGQPGVPALHRPESSQYQPGPQYPPGQFGQQGPPGRDRDDPEPRGGVGAPGNPRGAGATGYGQPEYQDPNRYDVNAYPSPATTVSTLASNPREHIASPPGTSAYGPGPDQYGQYGGRPAQPPYGGSGQYPSQAVEPNYRQERRQAVPQPPPDSRRHRHRG